MEAFADVCPLTLYFEGRKVLRRHTYSVSLLSGKTREAVKTSVTLKKPQTETVNSINQKRQESLFPSTLGCFFFHFL